MAKELSPTKKCPICGLTKPRSEFGTRVAASGNLVSVSPCKPCAAMKARAYYDPVKAAARFQGRMKADPEKVRAQRRDYQKQNPEKRRLWIGKWRDSNAEYVLQYAATYKREHRAMATSWQRQREARKRAATVVAFTERQLLERLSMFAGCWMCGGPKEQIDHVKPIARGGAHMLCNLRPACRSCNLRKKDKWPLGDLVS